VSKSDLLTAQVRTAQSQLDSLTAHQNIVNQRIFLAEIVGVPESQLGEVDTVLTIETREVNREALLAEASRNRPDLAASESELRAARAGLRAANFARLPYVTLAAGLGYQPSSSFTVTTFDTNGVALPQAVSFSGSNESDLEYSASVSLNLDIFTGFQTESRIASARSRLLRAQESRDALRRNLAAEVDQALFTHREARARHEVARRAVDAATENLKLNEQKYNVGSATILSLIDAQVQLQRAQSDLVSAMAAIHVAEARLDRVRGLGR
jgi:outer membrane protein TolC